MDLDNLPGFDLGNLLKMLNGNRQRVLDLLHLFVKDAAGAPAEIESMAKAGDFQPAWARAHKLKGTAGNMGAKSLHAAALRLEDALKAGQYDPAIFSAFTDEFKKVQAAIAGLPQATERTPAPSGDAGTFEKVARQIDGLLAENDYVSVERLDELSDCLPSGKQEQFTVLSDHIFNIRYTKARQVLQAMTGLPDKQVKTAGKPQTPVVLVVDDTPAHAIAMAEFLMRSAYRVKVAVSGNEALRVAECEPHPDLILLDVMIPEMNGFELCERLKNHLLTQKIPVIFVTAEDDENSEECGLRLGAVDYITKPFSIPSTLMRIHHHILLKQQADLLESMSMVDALTHASNRRCFDCAMETEWKRAAREKKPLSLLMIDIDHFKEYNDHYGHGAGDTCLQSVAAALKAGVSRPGDLVARYGGEEFAVILPETAGQAARHIADRLCQSVRDLGLPHEHSSAGTCVTVSIGCATVDPDGDADPSQVLFAAADKMLYQAKKTGRDRVCHEEGPQQDDRQGIIP